MTTLPFLGLILAVSAGVAGVDPVPAPSPDATGAAHPWASTDSVIRLWASSATATSGGLAGVAVRLDMTGSDQAPGVIRGRVRFGPSLLEYQGFVEGDAGGALVVDGRSSVEGLVTFELAGTAGRGPGGPCTLLELTFRVTAPSGVSVPVVLELDAFRAAGTGDDLASRTDVGGGTVLVR